MVEHTRSGLKGSGIQDHHHSSGDKANVAAFTLLASSSTSGDLTMAIVLMMKRPWQPRAKGL